MHYNIKRFRVSFNDFLESRSKADILKLIHGAKSYATGALLGRNLVLTANHSIERDETAKILYKDTVLEARVLKRIPDFDVALIEFDNSTIAADVSILDFGFAIPRLGETGYSTGYPLAELVNLNPVFYSFEVTRLKVDQKPHFFQFNSEVSDGCSGAPVVNNKMEILGVVTSKAGSLHCGQTMPTDWGFATKSQYFVASIQKYLPPINTRPKPRLPTESIAKLLNQSTVVVLGCG